MFFRSRRHESPRETTLQKTPQLQEWRRSAQQVTRAWNSWLAAQSRDGDARYRAFVVALGDDERAAAEVERMVEPPTRESALLRTLGGPADRARGEDRT